MMHHEEDDYPVPSRFITGAPNINPGGIIALIALIAFAVAVVF